MHGSYVFTTQKKPVFIYAMFQFGLLLLLLFELVSQLKTYIHYKGKRKEKCHELP